MQPFYKRVGVWIQTLLILKHIRKAKFHLMVSTPSPPNRPTAAYSHRISLSFSDAELVSRDSLHSLSLPAELRHTKPQRRSFCRNAGLTASWNPFSQWEIKQGARLPRIRAIQCWQGGREREGGSVRAAGWRALCCTASGKGKGGKKRSLQAEARSCCWTSFHKVRSGSRLTCSHKAHALLEW